MNEQTYNTFGSIPSDTSQCGSRSHGPYANSLVRALNEAALQGQLINVPILMPASMGSVEASNNINDSALPIQPNSHFGFISNDAYRTNQWNNLLNEAQIKKQHDQQFAAQAAQAAQATQATQAAQAAASSWEHVLNNNNTPSKSTTAAGLAEQRPNVVIPQEICNLFKSHTTISELNYLIKKLINFRDETVHKDGQEVKKTQIGGARVAFMLMTRKDWNCELKPCIRCAARLDCDKKDESKIHLENSHYMFRDDNTEQSLHYYNPLIACNEWKFFASIMSQYCDEVNTLIVEEAKKGNFPRRDQPSYTKKTLPYYKP